MACERASAKIRLEEMENQALKSYKAKLFSWSREVSSVAKRLTGHHNFQYGTFSITIFRASCPCQCTNHSALDDNFKLCYAYIFSLSCQPCAPHTNYVHQFCTRKHLPTYTQVDSCGRNTTHAWRLKANFYMRWRRPPTCVFRRFSADSVRNMNAVETRKAISLSNKKRKKKVRRCSCRRMWKIWKWAFSLMHRVEVVGII